MVARTVAWLIPHPLRGSGGHRTIYQNLAALAAAGYECHALLEPCPPDAPDKYGTAEEGKAVAESYFGPIPATFHEGFEFDREYDVGIATAWFTADALERASGVTHKAYFIQDYEAFFMPMGDNFIVAQNSYRYGFHGVTIGRWLPHRLEREFAMRCSYFDFCADRSVYRPLERRRERAICFVYQPEKPRRCTLVGGQALAIVKSQMPDVKLYFYGNDQQPITNYEVEHLGLLSVEECNDLYNRCQIGLCISATNPSRIPFEMMAAGLPVVDIHAENNVFDMPEQAAILAEPTPESIAHALLTSLADPASREQRSNAGLEFMRGRDLSAGFSQFVAFVDELVQEGTGPSPTQVQPLYRKPAVQAPAEVARRYRRDVSLLTGTHRSAAVAIEAGNPFPPAGAAAPSEPPKRTLQMRARRRLRRAFRALLND